MSPGFFFGFPKFPATRENAQHWEHGLRGLREVVASSAQACCLRVLLLAANRQALSLPLTAHLLVRLDQLYSRVEVALSRVGRARASPGKCGARPMGRRSESRRSLKRYVVVRAGGVVVVAVVVVVVVVVSVQQQQR